MSGIKLTVVTCNYNHAQYLNEAFQSVLNQKFDSLEYIIIDDGSIDHSKDVILEFASRHSWVKPVFHEKNLGVTASINEGLSLAKGKYIHYLSADDVVFDDFFRKSVEGLERNPRVGLCCAKSCFFHEKSSQWEPIADIQIANQEVSISSEALVEIYRKTNFWISGATILVVDLAKKYGGFQPSLEPINDWFLFVQIALHHGVVFLPEVFYANRMRSDSFARVMLKKRRKQCFQALLIQVDKCDDSYFRQSFRYGALLSFYGRSMLAFLLLQPKFWGYVPSMLIKAVRSRVYKMRRRYEFGR